MVGIVCAFVLAGCRPYPEPASVPEVRFEGLRGQVEVGGPFAGVEFHESRPLPARISFYYPVANSVDLSTDYWRRGDSRPFAVTVTSEDETMELGAFPAPYTWTPHRVAFEEEGTGYAARYTYRFAETLPLLVFELEIVGREGGGRDVLIETRLRTILRTSHTYATRYPARAHYADSGSVFVAEFDAADTDSTALFILNAGRAPVAYGDPARPDTAGVFSYAGHVAPGDTLRILQLIGSARSREVESTLRAAREGWKDDVAAYERRVARAPSAGLSVPDENLMRTARLAEVLLQANRHYLDGRILPMPCPAEYNFFFTHDLLQTDLAAVRFDTERVRDELSYLRDLAGDDPVLPHAAYWKDGAYALERAGSDNWNHLWFILVANAYLQHAADTALVEDLYPMLETSLRMALTNERNGLMYAERPDWWDIGHVYGARAYLTTLTIRAIEAFSALSVRLGKDPAAFREPLGRAERMRRALVDSLWDDEVGYLLNRIEGSAVDRHFYTGSLLAVAFDQLEPEKSTRLLETARRELLDEHLGIRNAMPPDFHELTDLYRFNGPEVGAPYFYMNGGIWPQGSAWYALAQLAAGRPDEARTTLTRYLSLGGVMQSPNGQPAFYEYRITDPASPRYGEIDKPTFLWAGGWYLNILYGLAGLRQDPWNVSFSPRLPAGFTDVSYDLILSGRRVRVSLEGEGDSFERIRVDGRPAYTVVGLQPEERVELQRGAPASPYLAEASAVVRSVTYDRGRGTLSVTVQGMPGQPASVTIVSAGSPGQITGDGMRIGPARTRGEGPARFVSIPFTFENELARLDFESTDHH